MGWLKKRVASLLGKPDGEASGKQVGNPAHGNLEELIDTFDTSW
jgi:hypothetical protein